MENCIVFKMAISDFQIFEFLTPKKTKKSENKKIINIKKRYICKRTKNKQNSKQISKQYLIF